MRAVKAIKYQTENDELTSISDTLGHSIGEAIIKTIASRIQTFASDSTFVAHFGNAKFAVVLEDGGTNRYLQIAQNIQRELQKEFNLDGRNFILDWNVGISQFPDDGKTSEELEVAADFALMQAKTQKPGSLVSYDLALANQLKHRLEIESELLTAISENQFVLHYQPQFDVHKNCVNRVEALIRWEHPERGFMPPMEFLTISEQSGHMPVIGAWVLNEAVRQASVWCSERPEPINVAVNVSVDQLIRTDFVPSVLQALSTHRLDPSHLEIEITESMFIDDMDRITNTLQELRALGIKISMDDFGTGYSSLSQLHDLQLDIIKIDRSFVCRMDCEENSSTPVVLTILQIAREYELEVVAEGAETAAQVSLLKDLNVDFIQGYYFSKPVCAADIPKTLDEINSSYPIVRAA